MFFLDPSARWVLSSKGEARFDYPALRRVDVRCARVRLLVGGSGSGLRIVADDEGLEAEASASSSGPRRRRRIGPGSLERVQDGPAEQQVRARSSVRLRIE